MYDIQNRYLKAVVVCTGAIAFLAVGAFAATAFFVLISAVVTAAVVVGTVGLAIAVVAKDRPSLATIETSAIALAAPRRRKAKRKDRAPSRANGGE